MLIDGRHALHDLSINRDDLAGSDNDAIATHQALNWRFDLETVHHQPGPSGELTEDADQTFLGTLFDLEHQLLIGGIGHGHQAAEEEIAFGNKDGLQKR